MSRKFEAEGIITALLTPLNESGKLKEEAFKKLIDFQIESGINGLFPLGTAGEGINLPVEKRKRAAEVVVKHVEGRVPVIVHVGTENTETTVELAKHAEEAGADAVAAVAPFFYRPDLEGLIQHYESISDAVNIPVFLYNNPGKQGYNITPEDFGKIAEIVTHVVGIKDTSYSIEQIEALVHKFGEKYVIIGAGDSIIFPIFAVGARAHISMISNVFPELTLKIYREFKRGNYEKAREIQFILNDIRRVFKKGPYITPYKEAVKMLHQIDLGRVSLPLRTMTEGEIEELRRELRELKKKIELGV